MTALVVAVAPPQADPLAAALRRQGVEVPAVVAPSALDEVAGEARPTEAATALAAALVDVDAVVLEVTRTSLTAAVVAMCDRLGIRILPVCGDEPARRVAAAFGLADPIEPGAAIERIVAAAVGGAPSFAPAPPARPARGVVAVWGPAGAPGRSTIAIELAIEMARGGRRVGLVDADSHAPSLALLLGLAEEGPGFPAACRQAERGALDVAELTRIGEPLPGAPGVDVLTGINRPGRWPELSERRVAAALDACRGWVDHTVVDVAAPLERDEEIVSDLTDGPRRNAAAIAALQSADAVVAVLGADPLGVARFLRGVSELRATIGATPLLAIANRARPGAVGIDARGQIRRTVERFTGIRDLWFVPEDRRAVDAALLAARPAGVGSPRSALTQAVRRFVGEGLLPPEARSQRRDRRSTRAAA